MTDKERLEEIKNVRWENLKTSQILHVKWLIERAQELENLNGAFDDLDSDYVDLQQENRRYREALEKIFINQTQVPTQYEKTSEIARKTLEESK